MPRLRLRQLATGLERPDQRTRDFLWLVGDLRGRRQCRRGLQGSLPGSGPPRLRPSLLPFPGFDRVGEDANPRNLHLDGVAIHEGTDAGRGAGEEDVPGLQGHHASHPQTNERISIVQSEISRLPRNASLTRDTRNYQQFRSRFR